MTLLPPLRAALGAMEGPRAGVRRTRPSPQSAGKLSLFNIEKTLGSLPRHLPVLGSESLHALAGVFSARAAPPMGSQEASCCLAARCASTVVQQGE